VTLLQYLEIGHSSFLLTPDPPHVHDLAIVSLGLYYAVIVRASVKQQPNRLRRAGEQKFPIGIYITKWYGDVSVECDTVLSNNMEASKILETT
jgi:hypothetical protein